jgi:hypothetical protein
MSKIYIDYRTISWGGPNEDDNNNVWQVEDGNADPGEILLANFGNVGTPVNNFPAPQPYPFGGQNYQFAFWNVTDGTNALDGFPSTNNFLNVPDQSGGILQATAWYALPGGGPGNPALVARTFDMDVNNFRKETPIQSASPNGVWQGPNYHEAYTTDANVTVTAKNSLIYPEPTAVQPSGALPKYFQNWLKVLGSPNISSSSIEEDQHKSALAVAFYGHRHSRIIGKPATGSIYDYWAEYWGRKGAEGEGPFGPRGPGEPWGPFVERAIANLSPVEREMVLGILRGVASQSLENRAVGAKTSE